jgi:hypothetical protein
MKPLCGVVAGLCIIGTALAADPIQYAASYLDWSQVERSLKQGADVNARDEKGKTPLILATERGRLPIIEGLLGVGADINAQDEEGRSVLYHAITTGDRALVKALIAAGADLGLSQLQLSSPVKAAIAEGDAELVRIFLAAGVPPRGTLAGESGAAVPLVYLASRNSSPEVLSLFLEAGADGNASYEGVTCLMGAAGQGRVANVKLLLSTGAKADARDSKRRTARFYCAYTGLLGGNTEHRGGKNACLAELLRVGPGSEEERSVLMRRVWAEGDPELRKLAITQGITVPASDPVDQVLQALLRKDAAAVKGLHQAFAYHYEKEALCFLPYATGLADTSMMDTIWDLDPNPGGGKDCRVDATETPLIP